ncbi:helix-turn-helix transcriptional regulator [Methyloferula stellata]|uniref:helix-turn-helix transcriptional regulator n=1 Tax=Methyloferula stellata TaxID=876270 RepID=UPI0003804580|nr:helix-turn-helix transcriptional regulator [Methyloferula stellata]
MAGADVLQVITKIYDGILDAQSQSEVCESVVRLAGGHMGILATHRHRPDRSVMFSKMAYNNDMASQMAYLTHFDKISPFHLLEKQARPGEVVTASHLVSSEDYKRSVFYNEWARKRDHWDYVGIMLTKQPGAMAGFAILRPSSAGIVTQDEMAAMKSIAPHLKRAFMVGDLLDEYRSRAHLLGRFVASAGFGAVLTTAGGRIVYANDTAEQFMRGNSGLKSEQGFISAADFKASQRLQALVLAAARGTEDLAPGGSIILPTEAGGASLVVHVVPLSGRAAGYILDKDSPSVGLFIVDRRRGMTDRVNVFSAMFHLTPAEGRVLDALIFNEGPPQSVAQRLKISDMTARTHLKHILAKTSTHRQADLVRLFFETTIPWKDR